MRSTNYSVIFFSILFAGCCLLSTKHAKQGTMTGSKFLDYTGTSAEIVPGSYLVMFDSIAVPKVAVPVLANSLIAGTTGKIKHIFTSSIRGFAVDSLDDTWAKRISTRADVSLVGKNIRVYAKELRGNPWNPVPWNLDRIDQRAPLSQDRDYRFKTGRLKTVQGIPIYILDNGIYKNHSEFMDGTHSRVTDVADVTNTNFEQCNLNVPDASHGTSIASIAAGNTLGITPTQLMNVKVLQRNAFGNSCGAGTANTVAAGLDETYKHMMLNGYHQAVINLSIAWPSVVPQVAVQIDLLQQYGAVVVAAAGNENIDASTIAPANLPGVVAVGATAESDARLEVSATNGSNFGSTVAIWAPGSNIKSAVWPIGNNPNPYDYFSGTSVAAPQVAGAIALLWQQNPTLTATEVVSALRSRATRNMLTGLGTGSVNALLYVGEDGPTQGQLRTIPRAGSDGSLQAVQLNLNQKILIGGGDNFQAQPFAFAAFDFGNLVNGAYTLASTSNPPIVSCVDISYGPSKSYFGCMQKQAGVSQGIVIGTSSTDVSNTTWQTPLGPGTTLDGISYADAYSSFGQLTEEVLTVTSRQKPAPAVGTEVVVSALDPDNGHLITDVVLTAPGFTVQYHDGVDIVVVDSVTDMFSNIIVATHSDAPGSTRTFIWKLDPITLAVKSWYEIPAPPLSFKGIFATAIAVQLREDNRRNIVTPGEIFLSATIWVKSGLHNDPWSYIYRINPDHLTDNSVIDVIKEAQVTSLWSTDGDIYFCGGTTRTFPPGNPLGISSTMASPTYNAFLGKSEGVSNTRRWMTLFNTSGTQNQFGYSHREQSIDVKNAYMVTGDASNFFVVEYLLY